MPTYDYECRKCGHVFEKFHGISDPPPRTCPKCKSRRVKRKVGAGAGILFRGSGFYGTDYRSDSYHKDAKREKESTEPKESKESKESKGSKEPKEAKEAKESRGSESREPKGAKTKDAPAAKGDGGKKKGGGSPAGD